MKKAVIFDMFETLITHYQTPLYFGSQMAHDAKIPEEKFQKLWHESERDRTIGKIAFEDILERILKENHRYSFSLFQEIIQKRTETKRNCFCHLHPEILPMLSKLKKQKTATGLISNCFSEEATIIRESCLFPYFDAVCLSYEEGTQKPEEEIYTRCMKRLSVHAAECLYVGDGGSRELETAEKLGMTALQAVWYLQKDFSRQTRRNPAFLQIEKPLDILLYC